MEKKHKIWIALGVTLFLLLGVASYALKYITSPEYNQLEYLLRMPKSKEGSISFVREGELINKKLSPDEFLILKSMLEDKGLETKTFLIGGMDFNCLKSTTYKKDNFIKFDKMTFYIPEENCRFLKYKKSYVLLWDHEWEEINRIIKK